MNRVAELMQTASRTSVDGLPPECTLGGRVLILITALLLLVMPWTEYFWHFDNFLRGGQDLELTLLSIAAVFCLMLVLSNHRRQASEFIAVIRRWWLMVLPKGGMPLPGGFGGLITAFHAIPLPGPSMRMYTLPILV